MAANIEFNANKQSDSFIESTKNAERAWHGLGTVYDRPLTVEEALEGANANFTVSKRPIVALTPEMEQMIVEGKSIPAEMFDEVRIKDSMATMRDDNNAPLGIVSNAYSVIDNIDGFRFIDNICTGGSGAPFIECAGVLTEGGNSVGSRVFVTAKFPEQIRLNNRESDLVDMYLIFTTSHTGKGALSVLVSPTRVVCANTLNLAFQDARSSWYVRHTSMAHDHLANLEEATRTLGLYDIYKKEFSERMEQLSKIKVTDKQRDILAAQVIMTPEQFELYRKAKYTFNSDELSTRLHNRWSSLIDTINTGVGQDMGERGTGLHFYNGVTCWLDNVARNKNDEKHFISLTTENGYANQRQQKAFDLVMDMAV